MTSIKPLLQQLENPLTATLAVSSLIDAGPQVVDALIQEIKRTQNPKVQTHIAFVLGKIGEVRASEAILVAAQGPNSSYVLVQALRRLQATDALIELYRSTSGRIQQRLRFPVFELVFNQPYAQLTNAKHRFVMRVPSE